MPAPVTTASPDPDAYRPAFIGIGIGLACSALFCTGFAVHSLSAWDDTLAGSGAPVVDTAAPMVLAGN